MSKKRKKPNNSVTKQPLKYLEIPKDEKPTIAFMRRLLHYGTLDLRRLGQPENAAVLQHSLGKVDGVLAKMLDSGDPDVRGKGLYLLRRFADLNIKATRTEQEFQARMLEAAAAQRVAELQLEAIRADADSGGTPEHVIQNINVAGDAKLPSPDVKRLTQPSASMLDELGVNDDGKSNDNGSE